MQQGLQEPWRPRHLRHLDGAPCDHDGAGEPASRWQRRQEAPLERSVVYVFSYLLLNSLGNQSSLNSLDSKTLYFLFRPKLFYFGISNKTYSNGILNGNNKRNNLYKNETVHSLTQGVTHCKNVQQGLQEPWRPRDLRQQDCDQLVHDGAGEPASCLLRRQ